MKALYWDGQLQFTEVVAPEPGPARALVRVKMAGICNTDLELVKGYMGFKGVLGHEFVGVVEQAGAREWCGRRVCGEINFGCGECDFCSRGLGRHCPNRTVLGILNQNGAFAEYVAVPVANLRPVPESVPDRAAVFVEPLAAAFEILEQVKIAPNQRVCVVGDGKLGLLICQVLKLTGCDLTLIGKHDTKLKLARSWGIGGVKQDQMAGERKFDVAVEASGSPTGFETAMHWLKPRGTLILKSTYAGNLELNAAPIVIDEITIVGSRCGQFEPAIRALEHNLVTVEALIDGIYPFEQALQAFERAQDPGTLKILLNFDD
ncbi:MAG: alcohol dehydrogenase catalytic domain-containing protein [bacterium]